MPLTKHRLKHKVTKDVEGTYYSIPFPVPENTERVTVSYSYGKHSGKGCIKNVVDLGLLDEKDRFLGWSGSSKNSVYVSADDSTNGYLMGDVHAGTWSILVGAYKIPDDGLDVAYEITYTQKKNRWVVGDLHMHSTASDGQHDIYAITKKAKKLGLDFIAVSNHNNYSENLHLPVVAGLSLIPAIEWTHYKGHMNFFGVANPFKNFMANSQDEMLSIIKEAKDKGAFISVNHPKCPFCPYVWDDEDCFDFVEVWNGPMRKSNLNAMKWWHIMQVDGKKKRLVGGSDYHRDHHFARLGNPVTRVFTPSNSWSDILESIGKGHCYVSSSRKGPLLNLSCETSVMGDTVAYHDNLSLNIFADKIKLGSRVHLVVADGIVQTWKKNIETTVLVNPTWKFAYLIVTQRLLGTDYVRAITNPLYFT